MKKLVLISTCIILFMACKETKKTEENEENTEAAIRNQEQQEADIDNEDVKITPIEHATAVIEFKDSVIYMDPTGGKAAFENQPKPNLVFITDIHGDHMSIETLDSLDLLGVKLVVPQAVAEKLPASYTDQLVIINNGETKSINNIQVEAIPMYNLREEALKFHEKGRGNGYVLTLGDQRVYFSGDTEDIPEMRNLKNIDRAYVCMNLPYTMPVTAAADAVLAFKPKVVYPYHYRGTEGLSDVNKFKEIVNSSNPDIEVVQLDWYPTIP